MDPSTTVSEIDAPHRRRNRRDNHDTLEPDWLVEHAIQSEPVFVGNSLQSGK